MKTLFAGMAAFALAFAGAVYAIEGVDLKDIKCLINPGAPAKQDKSSEWKDGTVYFCCGNCKGKFDGAKDKNAAKANHQLIATKQVEQGKCPISGSDINAEKKIEFKGATISFCCDGCKGKAEKMSDENKLEELFGEKAYEKAKFKKPEKKS
jgi:YHS domain-containing protein